MTIEFDLNAKRSARPLRLLALALLCASCTTTPEPIKAPPGEIAISNLAYGPLCGPVGAQTVCVTSNDIQITGKGRCKYGDQEMACTWYGFSFDYKPTGAPLELDCLATTDIPRDYVNIHGVEAINVTSLSFKLSLDGSGHILHDQYSGWSPDAKLEENLKQVCSFKGTKVFEIDLHIHMAPNGAS